MATLVEEVRRRNIDVMEEMFVTNLLRSNGRVVGAFGIHLLWLTTPESRHGR